MNIKDVLCKFSNSRVAVVGDVMLDSYVYGSVERISPEAPVLVLKEEKIDYGLGGAANVAANISSLGGEVFLFGYVGEDKEKDLLISKVRERKINSFLFPVLEMTTKKTRYIGNGQQQVLRSDREVYAQVNGNLEEGVAKEISLVKPQIIIASDYAKGCLTENLFYQIKRFSNSRIIVDPKPKNKNNYKGNYLMTPNLKEGREMTGLEEVNEIGEKLQREFSENILLTRGKDGMSLFEGDRIVNFPTQAREVYDITGAGDTVISVMALGLAAGLSLSDSAYIANHAAGIVVGRAGAATVLPSELEQTIESENKKIKTLHALKNIREDYKRKGKKVIWTNGCFDILHAGHVNYLRKAKELGDYLFVGLNSDSSIKKLKGEDRPINNEKHRTEVLSGLSFVDYITVFDEQTVENCLKELRPDVYVKAGDYDIDKMHQGERKIIESYKGKFAFIPVVHNLSTTEIIDKIRNSPQ